MTAIENNMSAIVQSKDTSVNLTEDLDILPPLPTNFMPKTRERSYSSPRSSIYVTRRIPQAGVDILLKACHVKQWDSEQAVPKGELIHSVQGAEGILCMPSDEIDLDVLDAAGPQLRVIATMSQEIDHINKEECYLRGIDIITCPVQPADNLAQLTIALLLLTMEHSLTDEERQKTIDDPSPRDVITQNGSHTFNKSYRRGPLLRQQSEERLAFTWNNGKPGNTNCLTWNYISQKTFGIYGLTKTGTSVAKRLKSLGIEHIITSDSHVTNTNRNDAREAGYDIVPFEDLLSQSDIICVCGSKNESSTKPFCREAFKKMKPNSILVTTQSEEPVVDYIDLYDALRDDVIKAAGLNDCNQVPVPFKTPLLGLKNCFFLPQTRESVYDIRHQVSVLIAKKLTGALKATCPY